MSFAGEDKMDETKAVTVYAVIERGGRLSVMPMTGLLPGAALPSFVVEGPFETRKQAEHKMRNMAY